MTGDREDLLRLFIDQAPVAIAMFDREMRYIAASRRWVSDYSLADQTLRGLSHYEVFPDIPERWREIHRRALGGEIVTMDDDRFDRDDGTVQWLRWEVRPWYREETLGGIIIFAEDISERTRARERILQLNVELEQRVLERTALLEASVTDLRQALLVADGLRRELREQAIRDPLTGLFNRRFLEECLNHEVSRALRAGTSLSLVMFDMDKFKHLNDTFGHAAGDVVLREVGRLLLANVRAADMACRYGGDEFIIVMPGASLEAALRKASRLRELILGLHPVFHAMNLPPIECSMGVAAFPEHGKSAVLLLEAADSALYRAKKEPTGHVVTAN